MILSIIITFTLSFKLKHYQRTQIPSSANVFKEVTFPQSELQCCQVCMNEMACDGVKYDGTICSALRNVKINQGTGTEIAFVDSELIKPKTKLLVLGGRKVSDIKIEVIDLEDPTNHGTSIGNVQLFDNLIFILYARWRFRIVCLQTKLASLEIRKNSKEIVQGSIQ